MPLTSIQNATPFEKLFKYKPTLKHLRIFGCLCYANITPVNRTKPDLTAHPCIFLGYPPAPKAYKVLDLVTHKIVISRDVVFFEKHFPFHYSSLTNTPLSQIYPLQIFLPTVTDLSDSSPVHFSTSLNNPNSTSSTSTTSTTPDSSLPTLRKSTRISKPSTHLHDYICSHTTLSPCCNVVSYQNFSSHSKAFLAS